MMRITTKEEYLYGINEFINILRALAAYSKEHPDTNEGLLAVAHMMQHEAKVIIDTLAKQIEQTQEQEPEKCYRYNCNKDIRSLCCLCTNAACEKHSIAVTKQDDGLYVCGYCYAVCQKAHDNKEQIEKIGE